MKRTRLWTWGPVIAFSLIITAVSSIPARSMPPGSYWRFDKLLHAGEYAVLGVLWCRALTLSIGSRTRAGLFAVLFAGCYGILDESYQTLIPGRYSSIYDAIADFLGAAVGALTYLALTTEKRNARHSQS